MPELLRIFDEERGSLSFDLRDLLEQVAEIGPSLKWALVPMIDTWIVANDGPLAESVLALNENIDAGPVEISWDELCDLADATAQTIWGTYVGMKTVANVGQGYLDGAQSDFFDRVDVAFQAVDSSYWFAWIQDEAIRNRFKSRFYSAEIVSSLSTQD